MQGNAASKELRYAIVMPRLLPSALALPIVAASFAVAPVWADPPTVTHFSPQKKTSAPEDDYSKGVVKSRYAGVIEGQVVAVDYRSGIMSVQTGNRRIDVIVLPSTNIQGHNNNFHSIADISKGARIQVFMSQRGPNYVAEIIHLH